jgi:hypothetical protein
MINNHIKSNHTNIPTFQYSLFKVWVPPLLISLILPSKITSIYWLRPSQPLCQTIKCIFAYLLLSLPTILYSSVRSNLIVLLNFNFWSLIIVNYKCKSKTKWVKKELLLNVFKVELALAMILKAITRYT